MQNFNQMFILPYGTVLISIIEKSHYVLTTYLLDKCYMSSLCETPFLSLTLNDFFHLVYSSFGNHSYQQFQRFSWIPSLPISNAAYMKQFIDVWWSGITLKLKMYDNVLWCKKSNQQWKTLFKYHVVYCRKLSNTMFDVRKLCTYQPVVIAERAVLCTAL